MQEEKNKKVWEEVFKDDISKIEEEKQLKEKGKIYSQYILGSLLGVSCGIIVIALFILIIVFSITGGESSSDLWTLGIFAVLCAIISGIGFFIRGKKPDDFSWKRIFAPLVKKQNTNINNNAPTPPPQDNANNENNKKNQ